MALSVISSLHPYASVLAGLRLAGLGFGLAAFYSSLQSHNGNNLTLLEEGRRETSTIPPHDDDEGVVPAKVFRLLHTLVRPTDNVNYTGPNSTNVILPVFDPTNGSFKEDGESSVSGDLIPESDTDNSIELSDWPVLKPDISSVNGEAYTDRNWYPKIQTQNTSPHMNHYLTEALTASGFPSLNLAKNDPDNFIEQATDWACSLERIRLNPHFRTALLDEGAHLIELHFTPTQQQSVNMFQSAVAE
ncbi:hypothetical protein M231_06306 [Tremella mesenterica]|uniref:Uncharacterized protein n=1 Tax=Tremella mesenterica TaxID=5217 RepID=A0A4Q1BEC9_TREME|nr:hypothetical protein M231_06306 [Tremella mesenterica]